MIPTALFFGSFNPIHVAHLALAQTVLNFADVSDVWFVVSPHNPFKDQTTLAPATDRLRMVQLATESDNHMSACDVELSLPLPSYSVRTIAELTRLHPNREFIMVIGGDNLPGLPRWREAETLVRGRRIIVYPRPGEKVDPAPVEALGARVQILDAPQMDISSTLIRRWIAAGLSVHHFVPDAVCSYIDQHGLYV